MPQIDLGEYIWPDASQGRQPQASAAVTADMARGMFASFDGRIIAQRNLLITGLSATTQPTQQLSPSGYAYATPGTTAAYSMLLDGPLAATAPWTLAVTLYPFGNVSLSHLFGFGESLPSPKIAAPGTGQYRGLLNFNSNYYVWGDAADWDTGIAFDTDGKKHTVFVVHDGTNIYFYRDGVLRATTARPGAMNTTPIGRYVVIGSCHASGTTGPNAQIASARAWSRAVSALEITAYQSNEIAAIYSTQTLPFNVPPTVGSPFKPAWARQRSQVIGAGMR